MFKGWFITVGLAALLGGCGLQSNIGLETTGYDPEDDVYIVFGGQHFQNASEFLPLEVVGDLAFKLQQGTHASIRSLDVAEVDYYYIWACIGEDCIPVDPYRFRMG